MEYTDPSSCPDCGGDVQVMIGGARCAADPEACGWYEVFTSADY